MASGRAVSVQWTAYPEVTARIYSTPSDAASVLGWKENQAIKAIDTDAELGTFTPIDYDLIGEQSLQGEFCVFSNLPCYSCFPNVLTAYR